MASNRLGAIIYIRRISTASMRNRSNPEGSCRIPDFRIRNETRNGKRVDSFLLQRGA